MVGRFSKQSGRDLRNRVDPQPGLDRRLRCCPALGSLGGRRHRRWFSWSEGYKTRARCRRCGKKLAVALTRPWEIVCVRCNAKNVEE